MAFTPAKRMILVVHGTLAGFLFLCMVTALHWPIIGRPSWWQCHWASLIGEAIGKVPYAFGLWITKWIPGLFVEPFAWFLAGVNRQNY